MTSSSPSNHHLKLLAGANRDAVESIRKQLSTVTDAALSPPTTKREATSVLAPKQSSATRFETWQGLWARDHKPPLSLDTAPVGAIVFHNHVPAIKITMQDGLWDMPKTNAKSSDKVLIKGSIYTYSTQTIKESELPEDVKGGHSWGMIGDQDSWGLPYTDAVKAVLDSIGKHRDTPPWFGLWSLVLTRNLAPIIAFGGVTDTYDNYQLAEAERSAMESVVLLAESGGDTEETVVLSYGTKVPSTHVPIHLAGRTSK